MKKLLGLAAILMLAGCGQSLNAKFEEVSADLTPTNSQPETPAEPSVVSPLDSEGTPPKTPTDQPSDQPETAQVPDETPSTPDNLVKVEEAFEVADAPAKEKAMRKVELKALNFDGIQSLVKSHKGKVVVMDCWATYCAPCIEEFPNLVKLHNKYGPDKVVCISLSFDYDSSETVENQSPPILKFLQAQKATFDNILAQEEPDDLYGKFKLVSIPAVFVYDQEGTLLEKFTNHGAYEKVNPLVEKLLSK